MLIPISNSIGNVHVGSVVPIALRANKNLQATYTYTRISRRRGGIFLCLSVFDSLHLLLAKLINYGRATYSELPAISWAKKHN